MHPPANVAKMAAGHPLDDSDREPWLAEVASWIRERTDAGRPGIVTCSALKRRYRDVLRGDHVVFVYLAGTRTTRSPGDSPRATATSCRRRCSIRSSPRWNHLVRTSGAITVDVVDSPGGEIAARTSSDHLRLTGEPAMNAVAAMPWGAHDTRLIAVAVIGIALIVLLIVVVKMHPFLAFVLGSAFVGLASGVGLPKVISNFESGVGSTLQEVGLFIALGAMLGKLLADSGGANRVIDTLVGASSAEARCRGRWRWWR
jgi:hypothetical protein